jgi:hypothetical protein
MIPPLESLEKYLKRSTLSSPQMAEKEIYGFSLVKIG